MSRGRHSFKQGDMMRALKAAEAASITEAALPAELEAIRTEKPLYNIAGKVAA